MMSYSPLEMYLTVLGLKPGTSAEEARKAYRKLVRENHPDLFPENEKPAHERRMMQVNEAYRNVKKMFSEPLREMEAAREKAPMKDSLSGSREIGMLRDPAYAYYKQGFIHYSKGVGGIMDREKNRKLTLDLNGFKRTIYALRSFHTAHEYFRRVVEEHPDSIWRNDAEWKIRRIEGFNRIYKKIKNNLEERLRGAGISADSA